MIGAIFKRDMTLALRSGGAWLYGLFFFAVFIALSAIALGGSLNVMRPFAPALIWLAVIFSALLAFPAIFQDDFEDGNLAQLKISGVSLINLCIAKSVSFAVLSILPLLIATPLLSIAFAAPALTVYGVLSGAILAGRRGGGFLIVLITSPFLIPLLIFGLAAVQGYTENGLTALEFRVLIGLSLIAIAIGIPAAAAALKANLE